MDSSELMVLTMGRLSPAGEVDTDQSDSSVMTLEAKLMSGDVDRPFFYSHVASFSLRMA